MLTLVKLLLLLCFVAIWYVYSELLSFLAREQNQNKAIQYNNNVTENQQIHFIFITIPHETSSALLQPKFTTFEIKTNKNAPENLPPKQQQMKEAKPKSNSL